VTSTPKKETLSCFLWLSQEINPPPVFQPIINTLEHAAHPLTHQESSAKIATYIFFKHHEDKH
jgi:hypothetical protein